MNIGDVGGRVVANREHVNTWEKWMITNDAHAFTDPGLTARLAIAGTIGSVGLLAFCAALATPAVGFTAGGVAAGSAAAAAQSTIYGASTCGLFSALQSMGATLAWIPMAGAGAAVGASGGAGMALAVLQRAPHHHQAQDLLQLPHRAAL
jgi:hypothetical protein